MNKATRFLLSLSVFLLGTVAFAHAQPAAPEIDGSVAASALPLVGGALLILRARKR